LAGEGDTPLATVNVVITETPRCHRCFSRMVMGRLEPRKDGCEKRLYDCPKCHFTEAKLVSDPLKSEVLRRLTENVRPPV
jgi:hypothetical protein